MAVSKVRKGHISDCGGTFVGIVYVCAARLRLKMQARPATARRVELRAQHTAVHGVQGAVAWLHLQHETLAPRARERRRTRSVQFPCLACGVLNADTSALGCWTFIDQVPLKQRPQVLLFRLGLGRDSRDARCSVRGSI